MVTSRPRAFQIGEPAARFACVFVQPVTTMGVRFGWPASALEKWPGRPWIRPMLQLIVRCAVFLLLAPALMGQMVALIDCTLIDTRHEVVAPHSTIVISGDRIAARGPVASTRV